MAKTGPEEMTKFVPVEWSDSVRMQKSLADHIEDHTGRRVGSGPFVSDIVKKLSVSMKCAEAAMIANLNAAMFPKGREAYMADFNKRFGL